MKTSLLINLFILSSIPVFSQVDVLSGMKGKPKLESNRPANSSVDESVFSKFDESAFIKSAEIVFTKFDEKAFIRDAERVFSTFDEKEFIKSAERALKDVVEEK